MLQPVTISPVARAQRGADLEAREGRVRALGAGRRGASSASSRQVRARRLLHASFAASAMIRPSTSSRPALHLLADLQHLPVVELLLEDARGHVRDAGDAQHADPHVARGDHLRHRGHADRVGAQRRAPP